VSLIALSLIVVSLIVVSLIVVSLIVVSLIASRHRVRARQPQQCRRRRRDRKRLTATFGQRRLRIPSIPVGMAVAPRLDHVGSVSARSQLVKFLFATRGRCILLKIEER